MTSHDHNVAVLPWPNGMSFTLAEFIAVVERRLTEAHETITAQPQNTVGAVRPAHPGVAETATSEQG